MKQQFKNSFQSLKYLLLIILLISGIDISLLSWYFPPTEGWWETFAWLNLNGKKMYEDIYISHPPLHILLTQLEIHLVGINFFLLRLFGVVINAITSLLIYLWLLKITTPKAAFTGTFISIILTIFLNSAYIVRDYHTTVLFFEALALFGTTFIFGNKKQHKLIGILLIGIGCGGLILTKQNIGLFFTLAIVITFSIYQLNQPNIIKGFFSIIFLLLNICILPLLISYFYGLGWISSYIGNESKGSSLLILLRFIIDPGLRTIAYVSIISIVLFHRKIINRSNISKILNLLNFKLKINKFLILGIKLFILLIIMKFNHIDKYNLLFVAAICFIVCRGTRYSFHHQVKRNQDIWIKYGWIILISLAYSGTNTVGYNFVSMQLLIAILIAYLLVDLSSFINFILRSKFKIKFLIVALMCLISSTILTAQKLNGPIYNWWGLRQEGVTSELQQIDLPELKGLKLDKPTFDFFNFIKEQKQELNNKTIFAYPSIPIVYLLSNKKPTTRFPLLWFDVTSQKQSLEILESLNNNPPDYVYWLKPAKYVYDGHEKLKGMRSPVNDIDNWFIQEIKNGSYLINKIIIFNINKSLNSNAITDNSPFIENITITKINLSCDFLNNIRGIELINDSFCHSFSNTNKNVPLGTKINIRFFNNYYFIDFIKKYGMALDSDDKFIFYGLQRNF